MSGCRGKRSTCFGRRRVEPKCEESRLRLALMLSGASYDLDELDNVHGFGDSSLPPEQIGNYLTEGDPLLRGIHLLM